MDDSVKPINDLGLDTAIMTEKQGTQADEAASKVQSADLAILRSKMNVLNTRLQPYGDISEIPQSEVKQIKCILGAIVQQLGFAILEIRAMIQASGNAVRQLEAGRKCLEAAIQEFDTADRDDFLTTGQDLEDLFQAYKGRNQDEEELLQKYTVLMDHVLSICFKFEQST
ncbi:hypothetical protein LTR84_004512 [Exophiala bonariae]|uniref:t-SNARE coiled-coil homology domain-containing protein n=1 Tax=Exophiala bonariae TaxID=1690606 RepID=A0AAV9N630_9EURO|nr:hypothetical protein LTR84_004512 [Exophiala bonariae]